MKYRIPRAAMLAVICLTPFARAATGPAHDCARIEGDTARLACYDQAFGRPAPAEPAPAPAAAAPAVVAPAAATSDARAPAPTTASAPAPAAAPTDEFGFKRGELERKQAEVEKPPEEPESVSGRVATIESRRGKFEATLDNGQVWAQTELDTRVTLRAGDEVTVRRAVFGSYLLTGPQGVATRVKRVR